MNKLTFTLEEPVSFNGTTYTELTLVRCKAGHLARTDDVRGEMRKSLALFAAMASVPLPVMEELTADDLARLSAEAVPLMGKSAQAALAATEAKAETAPTD